MCKHAVIGYVYLSPPLKFDCLSYPIVPDKTVHGSPLSRRREREESRVHIVKVAI